MKENFIKVALSISICLIAFPFLAKAQLPYSPCSPSGGKRADVLGFETKYRAPGGAAPTFTIPTGTKSIAVYVSSETGITSGVSDYDQGDEDFITINAIIDVGNSTSSGYVNYAKNTNTDGSGTNVYGWKNVALGDTILQGSKVGDALPYLNNVKFSISGNTLTIKENATGINSSYYVEYLSPYNNSLSPLGPQIRALLHGTGATATDLSIPIPSGAEIVLISAKGTNSSYTDLNSAAGTEEGYANMRFGMDLTAGTMNGFVTLANGGSTTRRSTYVISNKSVAATAAMLSSGVITGDYSGKLTTAGAVGVYDPQIYVSGGNLIIKRDANYARDFDDAYVVEFYSRVGLGMSTEFIDSDISTILDGSYTWGVKRTFSIPSGTNFIYFNETGNAINTDRESNENSLAAYGYIDLTAGTVTGYYYQQVGLSGTTRRDDNYAFKNVPLDSTSTRTASGTVGFKNTGAVYDISFFLSSDKSQLTVINKTGLANPSYQFLLSCDYYGSRPDVAFSTAGITFSKGSSCNIVTASVNVCNPGSGNSSGGMPVSFYSGDPTTDPAAILVYTGTFNQNIPQGECRTFNFNLDLSSFSNVNIPLTMILNDNGSFVSGGVGHAVGTPFTLSSLANQNSKYKECYYDNNLITATIAVNNCPVVNLDADNSSGASLKNYINYFAAGSATGSNVTDNDVTVTDPDGDNISGATIVLTNDKDGASEYLILNGTLPSGVTITGANTDTIRLTGVASAATYVEALKLIQYMNTKGSPNTTTRTITVEMNDGKETGPASTTSIYILTTPRVNVSGNGSSIADGKTTTSTTDGTNYGILTTTGGVVNTTFTVQNIGTGTISLTGTPIVSISGDAGFSVTTQPSGTTVTSGSGLGFVVTFNPASHAIGTYTAVVTILNNDSDAGRATYTFTVSAVVNNLPVVADNSVSAAEDNALTFAAANFTSVYTDPDGTALSKIQIVSLPQNGSFKLNGVNITAGQEIVAADLAKIVFTPTVNWNGTTSFQWSGSDGTSYATTAATMTINITPVNDAPTISLPTGLAVTEDIPASLKDVSFADVDAGTGTVTVTFSVPTGWFNTATIAGVTVSGTGGNITLSGTLSDINSYISGGNLTYSASHTPPASETITVSVSDNGNTGSGGTKTASGTIALGITAVNDAPTGPDTNEETNQDTELDSQVTATDLDGDAITFAKATNPAHGTVTVNSDGTYKYIPTTSYIGTDVFTVTVSDGIGGSSTITVNITVKKVNHDPVGGVVNVTINEDALLTSSVSATDADGDALTYSKGTDPSHGSVVVNSDGTYTYTPAANYNGTDSFTILVSDGNGGTATITVNITINPVNDAPSGPNTTEATNEDTPLTSSVSATDVDGDALTYAKGTDPLHGSVVVNADGTYTYTPASSYNGPDSFTVTVSDGKGGTTTITVNITVNPVNDVPSGPNTTETTNEDTPLSSSVSATDADGDVLTYTKGADPLHGSVVVNTDGTYTYTPSANYNGPDSFTVTVSDGKGGTTTITVNITVNPVNDAPSGPNTTKTTNEDTPLSSSVSATDVDGDVLTYSKGTDPAHGSVVVNADGTYTYTPVANYNGPDSFTVTVSDGKGGTTTITVSITVNPVNNAPSGPNTTEATNEDTPLASSVSATDADGDVLSYSKGTDPSHGSVVVNSDGTYTYTPGANYNGTDSFTILVSDGKGGTTTITVSITVNPVNDNPSGPNTTETTNEDTPLSSSVSATDADGDVLTYTKGTDPLHGSVVVNADGAYTYTPASNYNGPDSFTVTVSDGNGGITTITVSITVNPVNNVPSGSNTTEATNEDTPLTSSVPATDADGDVLTYSKGTDPAHGSVVVNADGTYTYTPSANYNGPDSFTVTVSDGKGGTTTITVSITVNPVNDTPSGSNTTDATNEDTPLTSSVSATDADGDALTYSKGTDPLHGSVVINPDGTYTYTPAPGYTGNDTFTVVVDDGKGGTTTITVTVSVNPVNHAPVATSGETITTEQDKPATGAVTANDPDGDPLTFTKGDDPSHGSVVVNPDGTYTYTPAPGYTGNDTFTVVVDDGKGGTTTITVTVSVNPVNHAPVATGGETITTEQDKPATGAVTANDPDGDPLTFTKGDDPSHGSVVVNPDGTYTYTPAPGYTGDDTFTVVVDDGKGGTTTVTVNVTVTPDTSNNPVAVSDSVTVVANTPLDIDVLANDNAGNSTFESSTITIIDQPTHGSVVVNSNGIITYTPATGYTGEDSFTYTVTTADGKTTNIATVKISTSFSEITVPTLFTPNGDGQNDVFEIRGLRQYAETELIIVNRWGNEVFKQKNYQNTWKGDGLNEGTYFYLLRIKRTASSGWEVIKGYTTLVRNFNN